MAPSRKRAKGVRADQSGPAGPARTSANGSRKGSSRTPAQEAAAGASAGGVRVNAHASEPGAGRSRRGFSWFPWKGVLGTLALLVLAGFGGLAWAYSTVEIPEVNDIAVAQHSEVYFSDGTTSMGSFSEVNRHILPVDEMPETVKQAVVASEDSSFYENRGISLKGILRAFVNNISGGERQGGSTITQQYVENYYLGKTTSYAGKIREAILAIKIDQQLPKDEILANYLNTIYFGRNAYGIEAAAEAYYGKDAADLTVSEAALLTGIIPAPSVWDPANDRESAENRWNRGMNRMVELGYISQAERDQASFPVPQEPSSENALGGTNGYLLSTARTELVDSGEFTAEELDTAGLRIVTTIDPAMQQATVDAIDGLPEDRPANNRIGTMTVDPSTGAVKAMYGGPDFVEQSVNDATQSRMQAGSIFKVFTLVAAIEDGYTLNSRWPGNSPHQISDWTVNNYRDRDYGSITLADATTSSVNTAYAELNVEMGPEKTREAAIELGLPEDTPGLDNYPTNVLGPASPTVEEMAEAYSTIASGGVRRDPFMVQQVFNADGSLRYEHQDDGERVLDEAVAANVTVGLQGSGGTASRALDRPVAGKTGTSSGPRSSWFVGFTPRYVTSVGMFQPNDDGTGEQELTPWGGHDVMTGATIPLDTWIAIMEPIHEGLEVRDFPPQQDIGFKGTTRSPERSPEREEAEEDAPEDSEAPREEPSEEEAPPEEEAPSEEETPTEDEGPAEETEPPAGEPSEQPTEDPAEESDGSEARRAGPDAGAADAGPSPGPGRAQDEAQERLGDAEQRADRAREERADRAREERADRSAGERTERAEPVPEPTDGTSAPSARPDRTTAPPEREPAGARG